MDASAQASAATRVAFLVQRIGPYHHARLQALARAGDLSVHVIEFRPQDAVYSWNPVLEAGVYRRLQAQSPAELDGALVEARPQVVVCVGYADREIHHAAWWALRHGVPLVTCSDSTYDDEPRKWVKEAFKRQVLSVFDAALVSGSRAQKYLETLGMNGEGRFQPWDVVDNGHFERGADAARSAPDAVRARLKLPDRYFLCTARFVSKKNIGELLEAFRRYTDRAGEAACSLVLSGSGPLEAELRAQAAASGLGARVHFTGFLQYPDLPACYGLADALILPSASDQWGLVVNEAMAAGLPVVISARCGCAPELAHQDVNAFTFEPGETDVLAETLVRLSAMDSEARLAMGKCSRAIVAAYTPESFAEGLKGAIACAQAHHPRKGGILGRMVLRLLALRRSN
jgi:glycosyltransferase involved in cell wall biosynthesis